jgi:uncharacterized protein
VEIEIGQIEALYRYPVKSMRGEPLESATMGWQGFDGDRRFALRRLSDRGEFPWLTAGKLPELIHYTPQLPTHVRTPEGEELEILGDALAADIERRYGQPVEMMQSKHGVFDEASISVITSDTAREVCRVGATSYDIRRFRPNIVVRSTRAVPFEEDEWLGGQLTFGDAAIAVTMRDVRCVMLNFDPDGGSHSPGMLKAVVRRNENHAGIYGNVTRTGRLAVGQAIVLQR